MSTVKSTIGTPRVDGSHGDIFPGSPLAVLGVFVEVLRARFRGDNLGKTSYYWDNDPTPRATETGEPDAPRKLIIESQYQQYPDSRDVQPALFVERGALSFSQVAIGNRADHDQRTGEDMYLMNGSMPISILCVSPVRGESMELGALIGFYLAAMRPQLREIFGFQDVAMPVIEGTQIYRRSTNDIETWITPISTMVTCKYLWVETPIVPKLREIYARIIAGETRSNLLTKDQPR